MSRELKAILLVIKRVVTIIIIASISSMFLMFFPKITIGVLFTIAIGGILLFMYEEAYDELEEK